MKTKTSILAALVAMAGSFSLLAQTNVYSLNVVGYVNVTVGNGLSIIANPLTGATNTVAALFPNVPDQTAIYTFNGTFQGNSFEFGAWSNPNQILLPGEGFFIYNPTTQYTNTFVGEVSSGSLTNPIPNGLSLRASQVPQSGLIQTVLGYIPGDGDAIYQYHQGSGYSGASFEFGGWSQEPTVGVGEGFFVYNNNPSRNWTRTFNPNN